MLPKGGKVTRRSILEYAEAVRGRYLRSNKKVKKKILDEYGYKPVKKPETLEELREKEKIKGLKPK